MSKRFVPKNAIVRMEQVHEDFELKDIYTTHKGKAGDWICTREEDKSQFILADGYVQEMYVEVEKVEVKQPTKQLSPFEEQYYKNAYEEMAQLNNDESEFYIKKKIDLVSNKAF